MSDTTEEQDLPERWSARRKSEIAVENFLPKGEQIELLLVRLGLG